MHMKIWIYQHIYNVRILNFSESNYGFIKTNTS